MLQGDRYNKLFSGINVKQHNGFTVVQSYNQSRKTLKGENNEDIENTEFGAYILAFNKNAKNDENKEQRYVLSNNTKSKKKFGRYVYDDKFVERVVNLITDELSFNLSRFMYDNVGSPNAKFSKHFYKENGKVVIEINRKKRIYNSYQEFLVKENGVTANIDKNEDGQLYTSKYSGTYSLLNIREAFLRPIENKEGKIIKTLDELYEELKSGIKRPINTGSLLEIAGLDEDIIKILLGDKTGDALIDDEIMYNPNNKDNDKMFGQYDPSTGETSLGNRVFERSKSATQQKNRNKELVRTLIHERLHKLFTATEDGEFIKKRKEELIDTLVAFRNAIYNDKSKSQTIKNLKDTLHKFLDDIVIENGIIKNQDGSTIEQSKQLDIIEEWLVESLTQPILANYLNKTKYEGADITAIAQNKSIFQKIVDVIIKLFNKIFGVKFGEIKNNTIFAKQYLILSDKLNAPPTTKEQEKFEENNKTQENKEEVVTQLELFGEENIDNEVVIEGTSPVEGEQTPQPIPEQVVVEGEESTDEEESIRRIARKHNRKREDKFKDIKFSEIPLIPDDTATADENIITEARFNEDTNPNGVIHVETMNDFINQFDESNKLKIATLLSDGKIKYQC